MTDHLSPEETRLVDYAKDAVVKYNIIRHQHGGIDTLYSFILSDQDAIYDGAAFESNVRHASICAERQAIANLVLQESYQAKIKSIIIIDPVPEVQTKSTPPCGTCRHVIWTFSTPHTTVS